MRTRSRSLCALLLMVVLLSGCTGQGAGSPTPGSSGTAAPTASRTAPPSNANAPPDTLRWSLEGLSDLSSIDPAKPGDAPSIAVINNIFSGLVRLNARLEVEPDGASEWSVDSTQQIYTFRIRDGLTFADGTPVTAEDFAFSINRALAPATASFGAPAQLSHIVGAKEVIEGRAKEASGVRALDPKTLQISLDAPLAYFLAQLTYPYTFVVPRKLVEGNPKWEEQAYGSGPYKVKEWKRGQYLLLEANERYWGGKPGIPFIRHVFNKDSETAYQLYQTGELDIMGSQQNPIPAAHIAEAQSLPDFRSSASLATRYIGFNNRKPPFDNVDVRRAIALATDRQVLANQILSGAVLPADRVLPTGLIGTSLPIKPLAFDAAAAKASLEKAGFPGGQGLPPITLAYGQEGDNEIVAQALQSLWEQNLGVKVNLQSYELATFSKNLDTTYYTPTQGLQFYLSIWGADYPDPQNFLSQQLRSDLPNNNGHFSDSTFDQLVDQADRLGDLRDRERRIQLYNQAEQIAIDKVGWLPLYFPKFQILMNPRVEGLVVTPSGLLVPDWTKLKLKS
jgi:ABC-type transport system substrate-binding protein